MTTWSMDDAMNALDPIFDELDAVCRGGLARYRGYPSDVLLEHSRRTSANCVYDHMAVDAERRLDGRSGVVFRDIRGLKVWIVSQVVTIRFKRMDEDGRSRNYPTKQAQDYDRQMQLPGLPSPPVNLTVGYFPNATETEVVRVQVARPLGKLIDWCAAIVPPTEQVIGQPRWYDVTRQASL